MKTEAKLQAKLYFINTGNVVLQVEGARGGRYQYNYGDLTPQVFIDWQTLIEGDDDSPWYWEGNELDKPSWGEEHWLEYDYTMVLYGAYQVIDLPNPITFEWLLTKAKMNKLNF
jgi:hypothetical protein